MTWFRKKKLLQDENPAFEQEDILKQDDPLEQLHQFLTDKLDRSKPIMQQVNALIDRVNLNDIHDDVIDALPGDDKEKRARLKDALIPLLVRDGYFNKL